jgi:hypothetical protein
VTQPSATTPTDTSAEPLWMTTWPRVGDVLVRWEDLTDAEQQNAIKHHNQLYGVENETARRPQR